MMSHWGTYPSFEFRRLRKGVACCRLEGWVLARSCSRPPAAALPRSCGALGGVRLGRLDAGLVAVRHTNVLHRCVLCDDGSEDSNTYAPQESVSGAPHHFRIQNSLGTCWHPTTNTEGDSRRVQGALATNNNRPWVPNEHTCCWLGVTRRAA